MFHVHYQYENLFVNVLQHKYYLQLFHQFFHNYHKQESTKEFLFIFYLQEPNLILTGTCAGNSLSVDDVKFELIASLKKSIQKL